MLHVPRAWRSLVVPMQSSQLHAIFKRTLRPTPRLVSKTPYPIHHIFKTTLCTEHANRGMASNDNLKAVVTADSTPTQSSSLQR
mmetsp:Transcript_12307/g.23552  ORF Transcript_12307/g.23552 Transcript_12307/m.23552 type:complete len:84 (-) Transcript_12307:9-260(-)